MTLIREQRLDKNGKLNTKLVRAGAKEQNLKGVPAPSVGTTEKTKDNPSTVQKRWRAGVQTWECDDELRHICTVVCTAAEIYTASDAEAYDILTVVDPENLHPLLAIGMRNKEDVLTFLSETGVSRLVRNNQWTVDAAIARELPLRSFCEYWVDNMYPTSHSAFMDAAEAHCLLSRHAWGDDAVKRVASRLIDLDDIKEIGVQRFARMANDGMSSGTGNVGIDQLQKIKDGSSDYDLKTMKRLLVHAGKQSDMTANILTLANKYGAETALSLESIYNATSLTYNIGARGYSKEKGAEVLIFADRIRNARQPEFTPPEIFTLYEAYSEAGFGVEDALEGVRRQLNPNQLRAVYDGKVIPAVAEGWL